MWLSAIHLPGVENVIADRESRLIRDETEWSLNNDLFHKLTTVFFVPKIDLFASRLNKQLECYVSWKNDPGAFAVDAFTICWTQLSFYAFPPFSILDRVCQKIMMDKAEGLLVAPLWDTQIWYPIILKMCMRPPVVLKPSKKTLHLVNKPQQTHPLHKTLRLMVCHVSGKNSSNSTYRKEQFRILMKSWRGSTSKQYNVYVNKWFQYSNEVKCNPWMPSISHILDFLAKLMSDGSGYSAINTARSALSGFITIDNLPAGQHPLVKRLLKGVFNIRPALPKYCTTWNVNIVLEYLGKLDNDTLNLQTMTLKLTMLLALVSGQRCQSLASLDLNDMYSSDDRIVFRFNSLLKQTRPSFQVAPLVISKFQDNPSLCVYSLLKMYLEQTTTLRTNTTRLLIMVRKPHCAVCSQTIARWLKTVLTKAGIDTKVFSAHSTRSAATSAAKSVGLSISNIMNAAG